jgi:hypothetical protein
MVNVRYGENDNELAVMAFDNIHHQSDTSWHIHRFDVLVFIHLRYTIIRALFCLFPRLFDEDSGEEQGKR